MLLVLLGSDVWTGMHSRIAMLSFCAAYAVLCWCKSDNMVVCFQAGCAVHRPRAVLVSFAAGACCRSWWVPSL